MNPFKTCFCLSLISILIANSLSAQLPEQDIDMLMANAIKKFEVAGAAIAIVKDDKIIYEKGFGVKSIQSKQPVDVNTNFAIASNSKAFTTASIMMLVEEGKLSLSDKVKDYIPAFKMYNDYVTENFTIEDLLTHHSGLGLGVGDLMCFPDGSNFTIDDVVTCFQYFKPQSAFRTKFDYDNQLYIVAGEVIARISGMSYEAFVQSRIINPLQMDHTFSTLVNMKDKANMSSAHSTTTGTLKTIGTFNEMINSAAGGIVSNVNDMCNWMLLQLNHGKYGSDLKKQLFKEESQKQMWSIHTVEDVNPNPRYNSHFSGYGLGWELSDKKGNLSVSHTGGLPGMLSIVTMIPDMNFGIVILTNTENGGAGVFSAVSQTIIDSYLGLNDFGWTDKYYDYFKQNANEGDEVTKKVWATVKMADQTRINNSDYVGIYKDNWFGEIEVYDKDGQLWFKSIRSPKLVGPMSFYKANTFAIKWDYQDMNCDAFAMFSLDEEGKAQSIKMKGISPNIDFSFDFHDLDLQRLNK